jgi:LysM repeat protein
MRLAVLLLFSNFIVLCVQANTEPPQKSVNKVQVKEGQTAYSIAKEQGLTLRQLHSYNNFDPKADFLVTGSWVYLQKNGVSKDTSPDKQRD